MMLFFLKPVPMDADFRDIRLLLKG